MRVGIGGMGLVAMSLAAAPARPLSAAEFFEGRAAGHTRVFTNTPTEGGFEHYNTPPTAAQREAAQASVEAAVDRGDVAALDHALARGGDINSPAKSGWTPLHQAIVFRDPAFIEHLLAKGADVNLRGCNGWTPLMSAAFHSRREAVRILLAHHADPNAAADVHHDTALHLAAGQEDAEITRLVLEAGASVDARKLGGATPLMEAAQKGHAANVALLLARAADVRATTDSGDTPLHLAATTGDSAVVRHLLAAGANVDAPRKDSKTPLHLAEAFHNREVADALLAAGASPRAEDKWGQTAESAGTPAPAPVSGSPGRAVERDGGRLVSQTRYQYDDRGNILKKTTPESVTTYEYNRDNQLLRARTLPRRAGGN